MSAEAWRANKYPHLWAVIRPGLFQHLNLV